MNSPSRLYVGRPRAVDPARLAIALRLTVEPVGHKRFTVIGDAKPAHIVSLRDGGPAVCDCGIHHPETCPHCLAVLLFRRLPYPVVEALRQLMPVAGDRG